MATVPRTIEYVFDVREEVLLRELLSCSPSTWTSSVTIRAGRENVADIFWSANPGAGRGGYVGAAEAFSADFSEQALIKDFTLYGKAGDKVFMTIGLNVQ